jgi:hypothetical protein
MAKAERHSNPFGWILLGALVGAIATAGVLLIASSMSGDGGDREPAETRTAAKDATAVAAARPAPVAAAPKPEAPPPVVAVPPPAAEPPTVDAQMADDAAAAGMTSRAPAEQPTN